MSEVLTTFIGQHKTEDHALQIDCVDVHWGFAVPLT